MKRGQLKVALILLGVIAIIALIGLIFLIKKTPSGAYYGPYYDKPYVLQTGPLNWGNVFAFAPNLESAESWCPYHTIAEGGFLDVLQWTNSKQFRCFAVPPESVPGVYMDYFKRRPIACFLESDRIAPAGVQLPILCNPPEAAYNPFPYQ